MNAPDISVVIPYYRDQAGLDLVLAGLAEQTLSPHRFEIVVADDGSPKPPVVPAGVQVVRQPDQGFRAGAARNLGAARARGGILVFLDGDTVPSAAYLERLTAACLDGHTLAVGARQHVDLAGWTPDRLRNWLRGNEAGPARLDDPQWLADGYAATDNLGNADDASFRYVISAVMALPATLFRHVGGFDESFTSYGGEDWDLAQRCWLAGADLRHVPDAIAFHDGGDAATRGDLVAAKNRETLHLATVLTHPLIRGAGLFHEIPDIVITADTSGWTDGQVAIMIQSLLTGADAGIWLTGPDAERHAELLSQDPRVHAGPVPGTHLARCRFQLQVSEPIALTGTGLAQAIDRSEVGCSDPRVVIDHTRDLNRRTRLQLPAAAPRALRDSDIAPVPGDQILERWRGQQFRHRTGS